MTLNKIEQSKLYISQPAQNTAGSNSSINIDFKYETGNDTQAQTPAKASLRESEAARESSRNANEASIKNISYTKVLSKIIEELKAEGVENPSIESIYTRLLKKKETSGLNDEENTVLDSLKSKLKQDQAELMKVILADDFITKTPERKLDTILEMYSAKYDENYNNLTKEEKAKYIKNKKNELLEVVKPLNKNAQYAYAMSLFQAMMFENKSISEVKNLSTEQKKEFIGSVNKKILQKIQSLIKPEELEGKNPKEICYKYADAIFSKFDEKYVKLNTEESKKDYIDKKIETLAGQLGFDKIIKDDKEGFYTFASNIIINCIREGKSIEDFMKLPNRQKKIQMCKWLLNDTSESAQKALKELNHELDICSLMLESGYKEEDLNNTDKVIEYLKHKKDKGEFSADDERYLKKLEAWKDINNGKKVTLHSDSNELCAASMQISVDDLITTSLQDITAENFEKKENKEKIQNLILGAKGATKQLELIRDTLKKQGLSDEQIRNFFSEEALSESAANAMADDDGNALAAFTRFMKKVGGENADTVNIKAARHHAKYLTSEQSANYGKEAGKHKELINPYATSVNENYGKKEAGEVFEAVLNSDLPAQNTKLLAQASVETTNDDSRKLHYSEIFKNINNPYVTEGLAAASKSVQSSSVRSQYNNNIQEASQNYTPEQQAVINQALETGEISNKVYSTDITPISYHFEPSVQNESQNITSYTATAKVQEKDTTKAYINYLSDVTSKLEQKRDKVAEKAKEVQSHIETSQKEEEVEKLEKLYKGISIDVINQIKYAYNHGGAASVYAKLGDLQWKDAQKAFLMYFIQNANGAELRNFADKYSDDAEVIQAICAYGNINDLSPDIIVKCIEKGWVNISNISDIQSLLNNQKNNLTFLRRVFDATKNYSILALNFDLLTEYISLGKINVALLPPSIYERYKNSLTPIKQKELDKKLEQDKFALKKEENLETQISQPIPGSPEFYAALNQQSEKYNPNNYFTGTVYDPRRVKKLNRKG